MYRIVAMRVELDLPGVMCEEALLPDDAGLRLAPEIGAAESRPALHGGVNTYL